MSRSARLGAITILVLLAFGLRVYHLGSSPLNGDEAFTVRYWAASPAESITSLATYEVHPLGTFISFWAWKSLVGESEFAMRMLPALANLLGVAGIYALTRQLFKDDRIATISALLWAINPFEIFHAQDVRNYAIWASLSILSLALLIRASDRASHCADRPRPLNWALYIFVASVGLYMFFLEAFMIVVHGLYLVIVQRRALRNWLISLAIMGVLLIPWFVQIWILLHSGYQGTRAAFGFAPLWGFWTDLTFGAIQTIPPAIVILVNLLILAALVVTIRKDRRAGTLLALILAIPTLLLVLAATRMNILDARYLIMIAPAIWIALAVVAVRLLTVNRVLFAAFLVIIIVPSLTLIGYYRDYHKAPDWFTLRDYLNATFRPGDLLIMTSDDPSTGRSDPALAYYFGGESVSLPHPGMDTDQVVSAALAAHRSVWFIPVGDFGTPTNTALLAHGALISDDSTGRSFRVRQYRAPEVNPAEIDHPLDLPFGGGRLIGYSLSGESRSGTPLTVLLYWRDAPQANLTMFVHLIGPPKADGTPLWAQEDHPPAAPGRDVYHLDLSGVPPGDYTIQIGLYDLKTLVPLPLTMDVDPKGADSASYVLAKIEVR